MFAGSQQLSDGEVAAGWTPKGHLKRSAEDTMTPTVPGPSVSAARTTPCRKEDQNKLVSVISFGSAMLGIDNSNLDLKHN